MHWCCGGSGWLVLRCTMFGGKDNARRWTVHALVFRCTARGGSSHHFRRRTQQLQWWSIAIDVGLNQHGSCHQHPCLWLGRLWVVLHRCGHRSLGSRNLLGRRLRCRGCIGPQRLCCLRSLAPQVLLRLLLVVLGEFRINLIGIFFGNHHKDPGVFFFLVLLFLRCLTHSVCARLFFFYRTDQSSAGQPTRSKQLHRVDRDFQLLVFS